MSVVKLEDTITLVITLVTVVMGGTVTSDDVMTVEVTVSMGVEVVSIGGSVSEVAVSVTVWVTVTSGMDSEVEDTSVSEDSITVAVTGTSEAVDVSVSLTGGAGLLTVTVSVSVSVAGGAGLLIVTVSVSAAGGAGLLSTMVSEAVGRTLDTISVAMTIEDSAELSMGTSLAAGLTDKAGHAGLLIVVSGAHASAPAGEIGARVEMGVSVSRGGASVSRLVAMVNDV